MQILYSKTTQTCNDQGLLYNQDSNEKNKNLTNNSMNNFVISFRKKTMKFDSLTPKWMNKSITLTLNKQSKLTNRHQNNRTT